MTYYCYIIYSASIDQYYIGHSEDLKDRLFRHNNSGSKATKKSNDWRLVYCKKFATRAEASGFEQSLKRRKSRKYIEQIVATQSSSG